MSKEKTFEENLVNLEEIVKEMEAGNIDLEVAIVKYKEAMKLANSCNEKLKNATDTVNKILAENGKLEDFDIEN